MPWTLLPLALLGLAEMPAFAALSFLALLQGLTEFLPVSSSGHLVLAQSVMGLDEPALVVDVALHVGTLVAVLIVYRADLRDLLGGLTQGRWREPLLLALGTLPAVIVGLGFKERVEHAFESPRVAAYGLFVTALLLTIGEVFRRRRLVADPEGPVGRCEDGSVPESRLPEKPIGAGIALCVGVAQAMAICPGISRSGSTIAMGLVLGLAPKQAARLSFLLAIPAILGAAVLQLPDVLEGDALGAPGPLLWAMAFAAFVGWGALRMLLAFLGRGAFAWFAVYCVALGAGFLAFGPL